MHFYNKHIFFCTNSRPNGKTSCGHNELSKECYRYAKDSLREANKLGKGKLGVTESRCLGRCEFGPLAVVYPDNIWYKFTSIEDIQRIIDEHLINKKIVRDLQFI